MRERYHPDPRAKSTAWRLALLFTLLCVVIVPPALAAAGGTPKDCVELATAVPEPVHEGRYNILCLRPKPGPVNIKCRADAVTGASRLAIEPFDMAGLTSQTVEVTQDGPVFAITGTAGANAHLFFSYDGPFQPIRDQYTLTCRW
ncbi:MAG: hypothetical protein HQ481_20160 [Alphaproteobacteria bacterium]|nr:hypothetical protein [Alphaproteobacteria bacterium]